MNDQPVSVIIPAYNCQETIAETIGSVLKQDYPGDVEIIVIDDGSTDNTAKAIKSFPEVKYIHQENKGPAAARNLGAESATHDFIFFTDSDCVPAVNWITKMMPHFNDASVAIVMGSYGIKNINNPLARCIHKEILFRHAKLMPIFPKSFGSYNFCSRKNIFQGVGGFNSKYKEASGEDNDLSYKVLEKGYKIYFEKNAIVSHYHTSSLKKYLKEQYRHGFWRVKMYMAHPSMAQGDDYTFWKDIVEIPLVYMILLFGVLKLFLSVSGVVSAMLGFGFFVLLGLELFYGIWITESLKYGLLLSFLMTLRAFARALGFASGILVFPLQNYIKKEK